MMEEIIFYPFSLICSTGTRIKSFSGVPQPPNACIMFREATYNDGLSFTKEVNSSRVKKKKERNLELGKEESSSK